MGAWGPPTIAGYDGLTPVGTHGAAELYRDRGGSGAALVAVWPVVLSEDRDRRRFLRDAGVVAVLAAHPNVVDRADTGFCADNRPYVLFPPSISADSGVATVSSAVRGAGPFMVADVLRLGLGLAGAVETAHRIGELHRGIEPDCVLLSSAGEPLLADFGMGVVLEAMAAGSAVSPPRLRYFTAPEVMERRAATPAADVYSLAATLYALLAGRAPHGAGLSDPPDSAPAVLLRTLRNEIPPIDRPDVPESLTAVLHAALAVDPAARTPSVAAFARSLQDVQRSHRFDPTPMTVLDLDPVTATAAPPPPPPPAPTAEPADVGGSGPDTLTEFWPGETGSLGPTAGAATSAVWVAPIPHRSAPASPPVEDEPPANVVFETVDEPADDPEPEPVAEDVPPPLAPISPPSPPPPVPAPVAPRPDLPAAPSGDGGPQRRGKGLLVVGGLLVAGAAAAGTVLFLQPEDDAGGTDRTTTTTDAEPGADVPSDLTASESPAGVQLDWEGDQAATYAVLVMSEAAAPKVLSAEAGPSLLVPIAEIAPDVGYCFAVANLTTVESTTNDIATAFSNPTCIRGASEVTVQGD